MDLELFNRSRSIKCYVIYFKKQFIVSTQKFIVARASWIICNNKLLRDQLMGIERMVAIMVTIATTWLSGENMGRMKDKNIWCYRRCCSSCDI